MSGWRKPSAAKDEIVKNFLVDYAAASLEVASYRALIAAAAEVGDQETVSICEQILLEDQAMAGWLAEQLPTVVRDRMQALAGDETGSAGRAGREIASILIGSRSARRRES